MAGFTPKLSVFPPIFLLLTLAVAGANGFRLKLIHQFSVDSPLYPGNLSGNEIARRTAEISRARIDHLKWMVSMRTDRMFDPNIIQPPVASQLVNYIVQVEIGTPPIGYYLVMDTGSNFLWIQCKPCIQCFQQTEPIFDPASSMTYSVLPCGHQLCRGPEFSCNDDECSYMANYTQPSSSEGPFAYETFQFNSHNGALEQVPYIAFGCGTNNGNFHFSDIPGNEVAGIMGLGKSAYSLPMQLDPVSYRRFSYCLVENPIQNALNTKLTSFLRFGNDAVIERVNMQSTPFLSTGDPSLYYLNLTDISIGHHRMNFPADMFRYDPNNGNGGCIIDTGTPLTWLVRPAFDAIKAYLVQYYRHYNLQQRSQPFELCYILPMNFIDFPWVTFHFQGADFIVPGVNAFFINWVNSFFCLGMEASSMTILGSRHQQNVRVVYDNNSNLLLFATEDCSQDAGAAAGH